MSQAGRHLLPKDRCGDSCVNAPWGEEGQRHRVTQIPVSTSSRTGRSLIFPSHDQSVSRGLLCVQPAWLQAGHYQLSISMGISPIPRTPWACSFGEGAPISWEGPGLDQALDWPQVIVFPGMTAASGSYPGLCPRAPCTPSLILTPLSSLFSPRWRPCLLL